MGHVGVGAALLGMLLVCAVGETSARTITGQVFVDANGNRSADPVEQGVASVAVSDGLAVVVTDAKGRYRFDTDAPAVLLRITVPRDHRAIGDFWRWADGSEPVDFALTKSPQPDEFFFVQMADTHVGRQDLLEAFAQRVNRFPIPVAFTVNVGDLVGDVCNATVDEAPGRYDSYLEGARAFDAPLFNVPGNHEHVAVQREDAVKTHPFYGKGLYRQRLGPMHYSWDWGRMHFVVLDGTSLWYEEKLGAEQRAWLAADLASLAKEKPVVLFCHQSLPALRDAKELAELLAGWNVVACFCGHLHQTFETKLGTVPVYHTGALSGAWWSGPNPDGGPQGFRLVHVAGDRLESAYTDREGVHSLYVRSPSASTIQSGDVVIEVVLVDFGKPATVSATLAGETTPLKQVAREAMWSTWQGSIDTALVPDGLADVEVAATVDGQTDASSIRYLVINGREAPYQAEAPATVYIQVRGIDAADELLLNGRSLGTIAADTPNETTLQFDVPKESLAKLNKLIVRAVAGQGTDKDDFSVGPVSLEYQGKRIYDPRFVTFSRHSVGDANPNMEAEKTLYYCLP